MYVYIYVFVYIYVYIYIYIYIYNRGGGDLGRPLISNYRVRDRQGRGLGVKGHCFCYLWDQSGHLMY